MTLLLIPGVAFAAELEEVRFFGGLNPIRISEPSDLSGHNFYYTTSAATKTPPTYGDAFSTISGAILYNSGAEVGPNAGDVLFLQMYKVETGDNTIVGYGEHAFRTTLTSGYIYTGTIDVKDNGITVGTFSYVYTPNLYTNDYLLAGIKEEALSAPYAALLNPTVNAELAQTNWYANYSITGSVTVNEIAAEDQGSWTSVHNIAEYILEDYYQNENTDSGSTTTFDYQVGSRSAYNVTPSGALVLAQPATQNAIKVAYTVYESSAATVGLDNDARLQVDGEDYVRYGMEGEFTPVPGATYDMLTNTLTLNGYNGGAIVTENMNLNIVLTGTNSISLENTDCISIDGKLTISGSGSLTVAETSGRQDWSDAIYADGNIDIQSGTLILSTEAIEGRGLNSSGTITINAGAATVTATGHYAMAGTAITITGEADIKEGDDAASAQAVESLTLSSHPTYTGMVSEQYVFITSGAEAPVSDSRSGGGSGTGSAQIVDSTNRTDAVSNSSADAYADDEPPETPTATNDGNQGTSGDGMGEPASNNNSLIIAAVLVGAVVVIAGAVLVYKYKIIR